MADISVTAASVLMSAAGKYVDGTAGATITAGQAVYLDSTTATYKLADSNGSATTADVTGIALNGASTGQPIRVCTEDTDFTPGATLSISAAASSGVYVLSSTPGGIEALTALIDQAAGDYPVVMFVAKSATKCVFRPLKGTAALTA